MKCKSVQQFAIVRSDSAPDFEEMLNARLMELSDYRPEVKFDGMTAYISYRVSIYEAETESDEYELKGIQFKCRDCPMLEPICKADGTEDKRLKYGECQFADMGGAYKDSAACEMLFKMIRDGRVGLCRK